ncbi:MAG TPA: substrate-binding domain-containing protein [Bacteroidia bacterium]|nr:substrate-binding domain-containing protein [Bacteroidia bacterium]
MISRFYLFFAMFALSCGNYDPTPEIDTPVRGKIKISIDENLQPVSDELIDAFESSYPDAFLLQSYGPEQKMIEELYNDSSRLAMMTRTLNAEELKYFAGKQFSVEHIRLGSDAVVFLVNRENTDSIFTIDQVRKIIAGHDSVWSQVNPDSKLGSLRVVFDNSSSSNVRYLNDTLLRGERTGKNCFALNSSDTVVDYVSTHPNAIGIVGLNWLSDRDKSEDRMRLSLIRLALIGKDRPTAVRPHQSALVTKDYPFTRNFWLVKIGKRAGLGTGFATFCLSERGQLIVQRAGLAPAAPAQRKIHLNVL